MAELREPNSTPRGVIWWGLALFALAAAVFVGSLLAVTYGLRAFSEATVAVVVLEPVPGVQCARLISSDGVALACWKKEKLPQ